MRFALYKHVFLEKVFVRILLFLLLSFSLEASPNSFTVFCRSGQSLEGFESCEEVKIIRTSGMTKEVYSVAQKRVFNLQTKDLFNAERLSSKQVLTLKSVLLVPSAFLNAGAKDGFFQSCRYLKDLRNNSAAIQCQPSQTETIRKTYLFFLKPFSE